MKATTYLNLRKDFVAIFQGEVRAKAWRDKMEKKAVRSSPGRGDATGIAVQILAPLVQILTGVSGGLELFMTLTAQGQTVIEIVLSQIAGMIQLTDTVAGWPSEKCSEKYPRSESGYCRLPEDAMPNAISPLHKWAQALIDHCRRNQVREAAEKEMKDQSLPKQVDETVE